MNSAAGVQELIAFAHRELPAMRHADGIYCREVDARDRRPRGRSVRYTIMVALGLLRARASGYAVGEDLDELIDLTLTQAESPELTPGDLGLMLWLNCRAQRDRAPELMAGLDRHLGDRRRLAAREGMEVAWIIIGASECVWTGLAPDAERLLHAARIELCARSVTPSGLLLHRGMRFRRRFPNFATQIYGTLALSMLGRHGDAEALAAARRVADALLQNQRQDGAWPWLFDTDRGKVVEPYEIYSVHQDAMAPMGLLELYEATRDERYREAAVRGLKWVYGDNEFNTPMLDRQQHMVYRSIRRKPPSDRVMLYLNTALAHIHRQLTTSRLIALEINTTDRPYHLGWVLEAWCGRERLATSS